MDNRRESLDDFSANLEFNALKDELNIILANSGSYDDNGDWAAVNLSSSSSHSEKKRSPGAFPLSRTSIHDQLFGFGGTAGPAMDPSELRRNVPRGYSLSEPPVSNFPDARALLPQMPRSSPGVIGSNYGMPQSHSQMSLASQQSYSGFGDRHPHHSAPPPLDVGLTRYNLTPPPPLNVSSVATAASMGMHQPGGQQPGYAALVYGAGPMGGTGPVAGLPGKNFNAGASTNTIAISPSYHQYGSGSPRVSPHVSPPPGASTGKENPNLHYRPNRDVQIANLAKAKAEREAAEAAARGAPYTPPPPPMAESQSPKPACEVELSPKVQKPTITYVYLVTLKTSTAYCLVSKDCTIYALSMNELVVFSADASGGEEIGFVSHIQTMKAFLDQFQLTEEEATAQLKQIIRAASEEDRKNTAKNRLEEANILELLFEMNNHKFHLPIIITDVQYQLDRKKLTIVYKETMEGVALDGRELMKDLFQMVQTRIVMKKAVGKRGPWEAIRPS